MEALVIALDAQDNLDRVLDGGLGHGDGLEAALQGGVFFDVFPVLVEGGGADDLNLPPGEGGLEDVGGVHAALGVAGAHQIVDLVDEEDHVAVGLYLVHQALDPALELAPKLGAGHQGGEVQQLDLLLLELGGHLAPGDAQGQSLGHGGLAHARLADEAGVVFRPAGEDLHHTLDLLFPADDVVQAAASGFGGEVGAEVR